MAVNFQPSSGSCYRFSLPATSLSRHVAAYTAVVCGAKCSMPVRLGHWQSQTSNVCSEITGQWSDIVTTRSNKLLEQLGIEDLNLILKEGRLCWYGHVEHSHGAVKTAFDLQVDGKHGPGRPKMTWKQLTERDCREWKLSLSTLMIDIPGDLMWDLPCVQQTSYLEGGPLVWMLPLYLHVNKKSVDDDW